jgi:hypothetical protein
MTNPITPPPELLDKWNNLPLSTQEIFVIVAQWGADQELAECVGWMSNRSSLTEELRAARRPKPPSLKEQALKALEQVDGYAIEQMNAYVIYDELKIHADTIRRALEALPE